MRDSEQQHIITVVIHLYIEKFEILCCGVLNSSFVE